MEHFAAASAGNRAGAHAEQALLGCMRRLCQMSPMLQHCVHDTAADRLKRTIPAARNSEDALKLEFARVAISSAENHFGKEVVLPADVVTAIGWLSSESEWEAGFFATRPAPGASCVCLWPSAG